MKRLITVLFAAGLLSGFTSCKEQYTTYSDAEYVMFSDTLSMYTVLQDQEYFTVPVNSTIACDYDRTFGVEIIDQGSNAAERYHYRLLSNTVTIKAGQRSAGVRVHGIYDNIEDIDSLGFKLKIVAPNQLESDLYSKLNTTKVVMMKGCPYTLDDFTGYCVITSMFLYAYPGMSNPQGNYQRLVKTWKHPVKENVIVIENMLYDGFNVEVTFDPSDPEKPFLTVEKDQILGLSDNIFGQVHGDNKILVTHSANNQSFYNTCRYFAALWIKVYVTNLGDTSNVPSGGNIGNFYNVMEWVSDEEAERLQRENGM